MGAAENVIKAVPGSSDPTGGIISLDAIENPIVREGVAYWRKLRGERRYPSRTDLQPRDIAAILRHTILLRALPDHDYEFRIVGDAHVQAHGFSMQGRRLSHIDKFAPGYGALLKAAYDPVIERHVAFGLRGWLLKGEKNKQFIYAESALLPLGPDDTTVDHVLNFSVYDRRDHKD